jgi:hypothetical protein
MTSDATAPAGLMAERLLRQQQGGTTLLTRYTVGTGRSSIILEKLSEAFSVSASCVIAHSQDEMAFIEIKPANLSLGMLTNISGHTTSNISSSTFTNISGRTISNISGSTISGSTLTNVHGNPLLEIGYTEHRGVDPLSFGTSPEWLQVALEEIDFLVAAAVEERRSSPPPELVQRAKEIVSTCALLSAPEPVADLDENGNLEIFFKRRTNGVLFVVASGGVLQVFGNTEGDNWRSRYLLSGRTWQRHLPTLVAALV